MWDLNSRQLGSFHLLLLLYEEYLLYMVDVQQNQKQERALWKKLFDTDTDGKLTKQKEGEQFWNCFFVQISCLLILT